MRNIFLATLKTLKWPIKLLAKLVIKKPKTTKLEKKCRQHVRNFAPGRLKNTSWQIRSGKKLTKKQRKYYKKRTKKDKNNLIWLKNN